PSIMFQCSHCDKTYQRKTHLLRHEATHTRQSSSSCPFCNKSFLKPEVTRRHSKTCAKKNNQPSPPAAKPGRKRQSCDSCFSAKAACDRNSPCSRCRSLGRQCAFGAEQTSSPGSITSAIVSIPPSMSTPHPSIKESSHFSFLRHFASPSVQRDRLAIGETAKCSVPRNLENLYSHLEDALVPTGPLPAFGGDFQIADFLLPAPVATDDYLLPQFPVETLFPSKLSNQLTDLMTELVETSRSMCLNDTVNQKPLDATELTTFLEVSNISAFISVFFQSLHWHLPVVHFPTFDPGNICNALLLSIFLAGAAYSGPVDGATLSPWLFDVAEEYIFRQVANLPTATSPNDPRALLPTVQLVQGALIMEMLQFGRDDIQTRRRIRIIRHPCLVSTIRSLGIFTLKRRSAPRICGEWTWKMLVAEEVCIRIACWVFLADGFLTVCFKNHPALSVFEMDCHFPWSAELWEAENAASFNKIAAAHAMELPLPPLKDVVAQLLETPPSAASIPWSLSLSVEHLLILIYAINSLAFQIRAGLLKYPSLDTIRRAAGNWKRVWDSVIGHLGREKLLHLGYPKHAEELWWLLNATLDVAGKGGASLAYLDHTATDELGSLNDFIQSCYRNTN
ncbi:uncharacterized protein N7459_002227, partial [Penicillium hispanicum]|uniref:uncharacterized protein n=1 Tax=Penicillium hispanicum TaxID=1080232 RepID=UPI00253F76C9